MLETMHPTIEREKQADEGAILGTERSRSANREAAVAQGPVALLARQGTIGNEQWEAFKRYEQAYDRAWRISGITGAYSGARWPTEPPASQTTAVEDWEAVRSQARRALAAAEREIAEPGLVALMRTLAEEVTPRLEDLGRSYAHVRDKTAACAVARAAIHIATHRLAIHYRLLCIP